MTGLWDERQLVRENFWEEDANIILAMLLFKGMDDWLDPNGFFSVKSAYAL